MRDSYKAVAATWSVDSVTGESHLRHRAHWVEGKLYYKGRVVMDKTPATTEGETNQ